MHKVLVYRLVKLAQEKSVARRTDCPDMTIAGDWAIKKQTKQTLEFRESDVSPGKQKSNMAICRIYIPGEGFRETYKSQNINPISPSIVQIKVKSISTSFSGKFIKNKLICSISISDFNLTQR